MHVDLFGAAVSVLQFVYAPHSPRLPGGSRSPPARLGMAFLGIDIGGTKLALSIGDHTGTPIAHIRRPIALSGSWATDLERLVEEGF